MIIPVDERLTAVLNKIEKGDKVADIGTDHGKLAALAAGKTDNTVIATDISIKSITKAKRLAESIGLSNIIFRVGNGLKVLNGGEADTVVIAGMGGYEIIKILSESAQKFKKYILVPHTNVREVRSYLSESGKAVLSDEMVESAGKFYSIIVAADNAEKEQITKKQLMFGRDHTSSAFKKYSEKKLKKLKQLIAKTEGVRSAELTEEYNVLKELTDAEG